jgi:hypothetical protein
MGADSTESLVEDGLVLASRAVLTNSERITAHLEINPNRSCQSRIPEQTGFQNRLPHAVGFATRAHLTESGS